MDNIKVRAEIDYEVIVGGEWLSFLQTVQRSHRKVLLVAPDFIAESARLRELTKDAGIFLFITPDGESQKDYSTVERMWTFLGREEFGRNDAIVAIGGGATTDLAGFVAATWLRGIAWYAVPTTLAGMVDASVGGKTGINTTAGKNLVGSFYSPRAVCADISWLQNLPDRDFAAGLAEVIKTGFIQDITILQLLDGVPGISAARELAINLVGKSVAVKAAVVSADFKEGRLREILNFGHTLGHALEKTEQGARALLNLGHTFGHALEKSANYRMRHGEAVAIGLHFAAILSESELGLPEADTLHLRAMLEKFQLPVTVRKGEYQFSEVLALMSTDKKSRDGKIRFVGIRAPGEPDWIEGVSTDLLSQSYEKITT
jgi:3-dehydroquinate synthase